jgi:hypothetical protein
MDRRSGAAALSFARFRGQLSYGVDTGRGTESLDDHDAIVVLFEIHLGISGRTHEPWDTSPTDLRFRADDDYLSVPALAEGTRTTVRMLDNRYLGTLVITAHPAEEQIGRWTPLLASFKQPVIFFDHTNKAPGLNRTALVTKTGYFRMHIDERAAISLALQHLASHGHKRIGIHGSEGTGWTQQRTELLTAIGKAMKPPIEAVIAGPAESAWGFDREKEMHHFTRAMAVKAGITSAIDDEAASEQSLQKYHQYLREGARSLISLLLDKRPTALICLNDRMAREYYFWLKAVGIRVPQDISLISFDNTFDSALLPVSTVDFGFQQLGYQAAHLFIGDLPVRGDRNGNIAGACTLVDRGSVARPGDYEKIVRALKL